jgi:hypothetical protein
MSHAARAPAALAAVLAAGLALRAGAQDRPSPPSAPEGRPSEGELFGAPPAEPTPPAAAPAPSSPPGGGRDEGAMFGAQGSPNATPPPAGTISKEREDPLRIGGQVYLRVQAFSQEGADARDWTTLSPNLVDLFLDVRPNDRVRAFALARTAYNAIATDPSRGIPPEYAPYARALGLQPTPTTVTSLDQLWLNFDVARTVFVTAGRQHAKWGVGRFWNPTDFLHRAPRDPLDPFDVRIGTAMVKAHLPWEARGWNAYAVALLEDPRYGGADRTGALDGIPVGGRVEAVLGTMELGLDVLAGRGAPPRYGVDLSAGIWDLDVYGEAAIGGARSRWRVRNPTADILAPPGQGRYALEQASGASPRVTLGGSWSENYSDEDAVTVGAEWFWQKSGYDDPGEYGFLALGAPALGTDPSTPVFRQEPSAFTAFQLGRQYAGAFVLLPSPGAWNDTTFTLSVLGNLSDRSFIARLDHSVLALTYLRVETFAAVHFGHAGGEFRLDLALPEVGGAFPSAGGYVTQRPLVDFGIALRVSL